MKKYVMVRLDAPGAAATEAKQLEGVSPAAGNPAIDMVCA
jgi:hypothetical protein